MDWVATANISIDLTGNATDQVVRMEIAEGANILAQRIITEGEFGGSTAFQEFELAYTLPMPMPLPPKHDYPVMASQTVPTQHNIDVRVYWYDQVNTYLDYVVLEDNVVDPNLSGAYQLFNGDRDADIDADASLFVSEAAYPLLRRFYLRDEPFFNGYQPFNYVDRLILSANIEGCANGRGRSITATPNYSQSDPNNIYATFTRFMRDGQPFELMVDAYPIHADIPVNTSYIPASAADSTGIVPFNNDPAGYNALLQPAFDHMTNNIFLPAIQTSVGSGIDWWYIAQVHGELDIVSGQYRTCDVSNARMLRPPSPAEIRAMVSLSLAYGAKGIFYFAFPTWSDNTGFGECASVRFPGLVDEGSEFGTPDHSDNYDTINGINVFTGYQAKYGAVTAINSDLAIIGPDLANLNWQSARTSGESPGSSIVQNITGGSFIEIGDLIHPTSSENYFMLVNRRCDDSDTQTITVTLSSSGSRRLIEDVLASRVPWDGNANRVAYRTLEAGINTFTITLNPGEGRLFRVTSGLSGTLTANRYWSGAPYVIDNLTVNSGITLTVERATSTKFASGKKLTVNGSIQAIGTSSQPIIFDRSAATGTWSGIWIENATAASTLDYCTVKNTGNAIRVKYTSGMVTIDHATLTNNQIGFVAEYSSPFTIQNSVIENNTAYGIWVTSSAASGAMKILSNVINSNGTYHGVHLYNGADAYLGFNTITGHAQHGVSCNTNSDPYLRSSSPNPDYGNNIITTNGGAGVNAANNSYPSFGINFQQAGLKDYYGYNEIHDNGGFEIANNNGSGTIMAERNYWSADHNSQVIPPATEFTGSVDYLPVLPDIPTLAAANNGRSLQKSSIDFEAAFALEMQDEFQAAADLCLTLLQQDPNADNVGFGVSGLIRCYKGLDRRADIVTLLDDLILKFPDTALEASAQDHSLPYLVNVGRVDDALARTVILLRQNRNAADKEPDYLFRLASLYLLKSQGNAGVDLTNALAFYQELIQKYAASDFAFFASLELEQLGVAGFGKPASENATAFSEPQSLRSIPTIRIPSIPKLGSSFICRASRVSRCESMMSRVV